MIDFKEILKLCREAIAVYQAGVIVYANAAFHALFPESEIHLFAEAVGGTAEEVRIPTEGRPSVNGCRVIRLTQRHPIRFGADIATLVIMSDVTEIRWLDSEFVRVSSSEKERIAQEMHDGIGQEITAIKFQTKALAMALEQSHPTEAAVAEEIVESLRVTSDHIRNLSHILDPAVEKQSLGSLLQKLARSTQEFYRISCSCSVAYDPPLAPSVVLHLQRIAQEAVTNARRHGHAQAVQISLSRQLAGCILTVSDNGAGQKLEVGGSGIGLRLMHSRAQEIGAFLEIRSKEDGGTIVKCTLSDER